MPALDVDVAVPEGAVVAGAVLLHPHPSYGGDRHNVVVASLFSALPAAGVAAARFDFDSDDLDAGAALAVAAIGDLPAGLPVLVVGYSFGALVALRVDDERVVGRALVAPPLRAPVEDDGVPTLVLSPAHDQFAPPEAVRAAAPWASVEVVEGADHFLGGAVGRVAARVVAWARDVATGGR